MDNNFGKQIEKLMGGTSNFIIFLNKSPLVNFSGAITQAGTHGKNLEIHPRVDKIDFSDEGKTIRYTRVYSDFPSSTINFELSDVYKVEEIPPPGSGGRV